MQRNMSCITRFHATSNVSNLTRFITLHKILIVMQSRVYVELLLNVCSEWLLLCYPDEADGSNCNKMRGYRSRVCMTECFFSGIIPVTDLFMILTTSCSSLSPFHNLPFTASSPASLLHSDMLQNYFVLVSFARWHQRYMSPGLMDLILDSAFCFNDCISQLTLHRSLCAGTFLL